MGLPLHDNEPPFSLPSHSRKPPPFEPPAGALTPPFHPILSVPFMWEEAPGRAKPTPRSSPFRPITLDPPPRMLAYSYSTPTSPVFNGPSNLGRCVSQRFCFVGPSGPKSSKSGLDLDLDGNNDGFKGKSKAQFGSCSCRWASEKRPKWDLHVGKFGFSVSPKTGMGLDMGLGFNDVDIKVKITRFRRSRKSLYEISYKSSRLIESIYESLKQMVMRRHTNRRS